MIIINNALHIRNDFSFKGGEIYLLQEDDSNGTSLKEFMSSLISLSNMDVLPYRLAILYQFYTGHYTPLIIEYRRNVIKSKNSEEEDQTIPCFRIYSTDSRALDIESSDDLRQVLISLPDISTYIEIYGLGLDPLKHEEIVNTTRQYDEESCLIFSIIDLELLLRVYDLDAYFSPNIENIRDLNTSAPAKSLPSQELNPWNEQASKERCYQITKLPPNMMLYTQSIQGDDNSHRRGLRHYIEERANQADLSFVLFEKPMLQEELFSKPGYLSILNGLSNPRRLPALTLDEGIQQGFGDHAILVCNQQISIKTLYDWHQCHDEKSFMIKVFKKIYENLSVQFAKIVNDDEFKYNALCLLSLEAIKKHASDFHIHGPKTNLLPVLSNSSASDDEDDEDEENDTTAEKLATSLTEKELTNGIITVLASSVLGRTPTRMRFFDKGELSETPASRKNSPEQAEYPPPSVLMAHTYLSTSFRDVPQQNDSFSHKSQ